MAVSFFFFFPLPFSSQRWVANTFLSSEKWKPEVGCLKVDTAWSFTCEYQLQHLNQQNFSKKKNLNQQNLVLVVFGQCWCDHILVNEGLIYQSKDLVNIVIKRFFFFLFQNLGNIGTIFAYLDRSACYTVDNRILNEYANISSSDQKIYDSCTYYAPLCGLSPFPLNTTKCRVLMRELIHILVFTHILVESCDIV